MSAIYKNFASLKQALSENKTSCTQLVDDYLQRIEAFKDFNIFLEIYADEARERAQEIDKKIASGTAKKLAGMVIALKDNICYKDHKVSAGSKILSGFQSLYTATAVERLLAEDAIIIGRVNCDEFAMGSSNENSSLGPVKNPIDKERVPGGSSGGSAAAVAANLCMIALGSDTGGSIRQPASFCNVVGFKPSYGRVSRYGLIAYASSFDQIGPICHSVDDAALVHEIMAGKDKMDSTSSSKAVENVYPINNWADNKPKVGFVKDCWEHPNLDPKVKEEGMRIKETLIADGYEIVDIEFPYFDFLVPTYYVLTTAEASSNLSRFGGVHYGYRSESAQDIASTYARSRAEGFGPEVKRRIMLGTFVLSAGFYDAYYSRAQKVRRVLSEKTDEIFQQVDVLLLPTTPKGAFKLGQINDPITMYLEDIFTVWSNLTGNPSISIPLLESTEKLPVGLQLITNKFEEGVLFKFSKFLTERCSKINV